jgi:hypothetical protein
LRAAESATTSPWKAGAAVVDITPDGPMWLAGYGGRKRPSDGVAQRLFAKALALEDGAGAQMVFVTLDLIHVPRALREGVERALCVREVTPKIWDGIRHPGRRTRKRTSSRECMNSSVRLTQLC